MSAPARLGLTARTVILTVSVAAVAVAVAAALAFPLIRSAAQSEATARLATFADITAASVAGQGNRPGPLLPRQLVQSLEAEGITGYLVLRPEAEVPGLDPAEVAAVFAGTPVSVVAATPTGDLLIEGRRAEGGVAIVLTQPSAVIGEITRQTFARLAVALLVGLLIAAIVGYLASLRSTRPLRAARAAAARMAAGERDVEIRPEGPAEIADIAIGLNRLSSALTASEARQRDFLLSVSHELRTPTTAVRGYGEALADGLIEPADVPRVGEVISTEADRLERLVSDLLELARLGAADFRFDIGVVDIRAVLIEAESTWSLRCAPLEVSIAVAVPGDPLPVRTDPVRLRQVIDNLVENALRVSPAGSTIALGAHRGDGLALITVDDDGPGLSEEDRAVAFEPGALHERYRGIRPVGTGVGLALVARLATGMGGTAAVESRPGGGTRFVIGVRVEGLEPSRPTDTGT